MKAPDNKVIVRADDIYNYFVEHGSLKLYVDPMFNKGVAKIKSAEVVAIPSGMYDWCKIIPSVQVGDKVYFHYNALQEDGAVPDHKGLWVIGYQDIFCAVRNGEIIMINGRILAKPVYEGAVDMEIGGTVKKVVVSKSGIITDMNPSHDQRKAVLAHIGEPNLGEPRPEAKVGDVFYYINNADFINIIEGEKYFVMFQDEILAIHE